MVEDHTLLGIIFHEQGKLNEAFAQYREALRHGGGAGECLPYLLQATGKPEDVLRTYREVLERRVQTQAKQAGSVQ